MPYSTMQAFFGVKTTPDLVRYFISLKNEALSELKSELAGNKKTLGPDELYPKMVEILKRTFSQTTLQTYSFEDLHKLYVDLERGIPVGNEITVMSTLPTTITEELSNHAIMTPKGLFEWDGKAFNCIIKPDVLNETAFFKRTNIKWTEKNLDMLLDLDKCPYDALLKLDDISAKNHGQLYSTRHGGELWQVCLVVPRLLQEVVSEEINPRADEKIQLIVSKCIDYLIDLNQRPSSPFVTKKIDEVTKIINESKTDNPPVERLTKINEIINDKQFKDIIEKADSLGMKFMKALHMILNPILGMHLWKNDWSALKPPLDVNPKPTEGRDNGMDP